tara:strand:- start:8752 stop:9333 length:582 start_codon:yes stop_codon:yes gene_type:complete
MGFNLKDYALVNDRIKEFHNMYPYGMIVTKVIEVTQVIDTPTGEQCNEYRIQATVTPNVLEVPERYFTGTAAERDNTGFVNKTSAMENCETSAVGRALANMGIGADFAIASKEEVENAKAKQAVFKPKVKELTEIDTLAKKCEKAQVIPEEAYLAYTKKRESGFYDTVARVKTAKKYFEDQLKEAENVKKENA